MPDNRKSLEPWRAQQAPADIANARINQVTQWPSVFEPSWSMFQPGEPLIPTEQEPVRSIDFPVGINTIIYPRVPETWGFAELRAFANVEVVRLAIETRKDQIERLGWKVRPRDDWNRKKVRKDAQERINRAKRFFDKPDGVNDFHVWLRILLEDLLVLDAPVLEKRRRRDGTLMALDHVPGDTIKLLLDHNGRRPQPPTPAYQQIIKGRVWANLTCEDIIYAPRNPRSGKMYGMGPVEQTIVTINTFMRRQASQLAYFSDGTVPAGLATVPDGWTVDQIKQWQEWMDANFAGNLAERRKILWAPAGSKYQAFKEAPLKDDYDEWLARIVCFAFGLPPTPFIRQMNRGTARDDDERALEEGLAPTLVWTKRLCDDILDELGFPELEFSWQTGKEVDIKVQTDTNDKYLRGGIITINEVRDTLGYDPVEGGDTPLIYTAKGAVTLDMVLNPPPDSELGDAAGAAKNGDGSKTASSDDGMLKELAAIAGSLQDLQRPLAQALGH